jgi:hypothetical protein
VGVFTGRKTTCAREFNRYQFGGVMPDKKESFRDLVLKKAEEGKVVFMTFEGPMEVDLAKFIEQPTEGILYDLNRDKATVLTFIEDPKWVNDFAVGQVIAKLKEIIDNQQKEIEDLATGAEERQKKNKPNIQELVQGWLEENDCVLNNGYCTCGFGESMGCMKGNIPTCRAVPIAKVEHEDKT